MVRGVGFQVAVVAGGNLPSACRRKANAGPVMDGEEKLRASVSAGCRKSADTVTAASGLRRSTSRASAPTVDLPLECPILERAHRCAQKAGATFSDNASPANCDPKNVVELPLL